jgi:hypothetical protein
LKTRRQSIAEGVAMVHKLASALDNHSSSDEDDAMGEIEEEHSDSSSGGGGEIVWEDGDQFDPDIEENREQYKLAWILENIDSDEKLDSDKLTSVWNDSASMNMRDDKRNGTIKKLDVSSFWENDDDDMSDEYGDVVRHAEMVLEDMRAPADDTATDTTKGRKVATTQGVGVSFAPLIGTEQDRSEEKNEEDVIDGMYGQDSQKNEEEDRERTRTSSFITRKLEEHVASMWMSDDDDDDDGF